MSVPRDDATEGVPDRAVKDAQTRPAPGQCAPSRARPAASAIRCDNASVQARPSVTAPTSCASAARAASRSRGTLGDAGPFTIAKELIAGVSQA